MLSKMSVLFRCIYGPELLRIYRSVSKGDQYTGNALERYSSTVISSIQAAVSVSIYASPVILTWLHRRDFFNYDGLVYLSKFLAGITLIYFGAFYIRGIGRVFNPVYRQFIDILAKVSRNFTPENKALISVYDFDFGAWPVEFSNLNSGQASFVKNLTEQTFWEKCKNLPVYVSSWLMLHSFGIKLIYPGSIQLLQASISTPLQEGRAQLVMEKSGQRSKVVSSDGNSLDTMFFDRRGKNGEKGDILVISCDGNAGFYEIGVMGTPIEMGYSVLGWNHPGFGGSTGTPYPQQEANAADAVMQFAIQKLGFTPDQIILHGWSIGGFTTTCIAMNYPEVKGVVIDASFDQLLPLAVPRMPACLEPLVSGAVQNFISLDISGQLRLYNGPVRIIRRALDEMVTTDMENLESNRGNHLLVKLLEHRYPKLIEKETLDSLWSFLSREESGQLEKMAELKIEEKDMLSKLPESKDFPSTVGEEMKIEDKIKLLLFLAKAHLEEVDSTHCTPLPKDKFHLPKL